MFFLMAKLIDAVIPAELYSANRSSCFPHSHIQHRFELWNPVGVRRESVVANLTAEYDTEGCSTGEFPNVYRLNYEGNASRRGNNNLLKHTCARIDTQWMCKQCRDCGLRTVLQYQESR